MAFGRAIYRRAARQSILSVLAQTPFDVYVVHDSGENGWVPGSPRVFPVDLPPLPATHARALPFLRKFEAMRSCLAASAAPLIVLLDADTVVLDRIEAADVEAALDGYELAAAEQPTVVRTGWSRVELREHYIRHTLAWLGPGLDAPPLADFRFHQSGVVFGRRAAWQRFVTWALDTIARGGDEHRVGEHMIADQDYLQFWGNNLHPGTVRTLPWQWNHCEHWDDDFPRDGARVAHLSNFCLGPGRRQLLRLWALRLATRGGRRPRGVLRWIVAGPIARVGT